MAFRKYTQCYDHTLGDRPFNKDDLAGLAVLHGLAPGAFFGALTGLAVGLAVGGPIGAAVGFLVGLFTTATVGVTFALHEAAQKWRFHRLVCRTGVKCAVGAVHEDPERGDLGEFDNDEFFDLVLMPHRVDDEPTGTLGKNNVYDDDFQGQELMKPSIDDLPYDLTRRWLHCEAEGDFWVRMADLALALGLLTGLVATATVAAGAGGAVAGAAAGCAIGAIFGGIGCIIGAILGAILGALLAGGGAAVLGGLLIEAVLNAIFETDPGEVEDANVGDRERGAITVGDKVAVLGEHVYDGFHEGWHEIHPLMAVVKMGDETGRWESAEYLEWDPSYSGSDPRPDGLTAADMKAGLNSPSFSEHAVALRQRWCDLLHERFDEAVTKSQQELTQRWTIHPSVDGCVPTDGDRGNGLDIG
jgi:hypothetical protein